MGFGDVLKQIGKGFLVGVKVARPVFSQLGNATPGPDIFEGVAGILGVVELTGELASSQGMGKLNKLQLALPQVEELIRSTELVSSHEIADQALFSAGAQDVLEGVLKVTKALRDKNDKTVPAPAAG